MERMNNPFDFAQRITEEIAFKIEHMELEIAELREMLSKDGTFLNMEDTTIHAQGINVNNLDLVSNKN